MTLKSDTKFGEESTCCVFQNWHEEFDKFWPEHLKVSKKFPFNRLFFSKVYIVWAKKVQRSYLSWHWRVIQNLEANRLVLKLTWGIWQIFTRALESVKIGTLMGSFCPKLKIYELKIYRRVMCHDNEEWHDMRNLMNFDSSTRKSKKFAV